MVNQNVQKIPEDWDLQPLGNSHFFELKTGGTPSTEKSEYWDNGTIDWLSSGEVHNKRVYNTEKKITQKGYDYSNATYIPPKSTLIALAGQGKTRGTAAISEIKLTTNQSVAAIIPNKKLVDPYYLYHYIDSQYWKFRSISAGTGRAGLSLSILSSFNIPLPPFEEQRYISMIFEKVDESIDQTEKIIEKHERIKTGLMQDLFTKGIDEKGNIRSEKTHKFRDSPLGRIPEDWDFGTLDSIVTIESGGTPSTYNKEYWDGTIVWITPDDFKNYYSKYVNNSMRRISRKGLENSSAKVIPKNSIVMSSRAPIGYFAIVTVEYTTNQGCKSLICNKIYNEYLYYYLCHVVDKIKQKGEGTTFSEISKTQLQEFLIKFPKKKEEQEGIVKMLDNVDRTVLHEKQVLTKLKHIKAGLMQDLLTPKIRVTHLLDREVAV